MIQQVIGVDAARIEPLQLVKYLPGQCAWKSGTIDPIQLHRDVVIQNQTHRCIVEVLQSAHGHA